MVMLDKDLEFGSQEIKGAPETRAVPDTLAKGHK
jgi:hypothetical protein